MISGLLGRASRRIWPTLWVRQGLGDTSLLRGKRPIGQCLGHKRRWWRADEYWIEELCVDNDVHGRGIGSRLLAYVQEHLGQEGVRSITLLTKKDIPAAKFYAKHGVRDQCEPGLHVQGVGSGRAKRGRGDMPMNLEKLRASRQKRDLKSFPDPDRAGDDSSGRRRVWRHRWRVGDPQRYCLCGARTRGTDRSQRGRDQAVGARWLVPKRGRRPGRLFLIEAYPLLCFGV